MVLNSVGESDGSESIQTVTETENGCFAGDESVTLPMRADVVRYGILTTALYLDDCNLKVTYNYLSLPKALDFLGIFN